MEAIPVRLAVRDAPASDVYERLRFVAFENGADDLLFVDHKYGMWSSGEFDLRLFERLIYSGRILHPLHGGVLINIGDVVPPLAGELRVTRIAGNFKP